MDNKNRPWVMCADVVGEEASPGVVRSVLAYSDSIMAVENRFEKGAIGAMHSHPHTQITYILSGIFEFTIGQEKKIVQAGDSMLDISGVMHGCTCLESGTLLDVFTPMREDFILCTQDNPQAIRPDMYSSNGKLDENQ